MLIVNRKLVKYEVELCTGLHIGGNKESYGIGGIDSPVIKDPLTNQPIIPGSSVKGKIRMLLTCIGTDNNLQEDIDKAFGSNNKDTGITRIIFRDLFLTDDSVKKLESKLGRGFYTEVKAENKIEKLKANPRFIERVPAGAKFNGECVVQYLENDDNLVELLKKGFELLENSALGGSGSRGYGKVKIIIESINDITNNSIKDM